MNCIARKEHNTPIRNINIKMPKIIMIIGHIYLPCIPTNNMQPSLKDWTKCHIGLVFCITNMALSKSVCTTTWGTLGKDQANHHWNHICWFPNITMQESLFQSISAILATWLCNTGKFFSKWIPLTLDLANNPYKILWPPMRHSISSGMTWLISFEQGIQILPYY